MVLRELLTLCDDVASLERIPTPQSPGAKGVGAEIAGLVVGITGGLPGVLALVERWRTRGGVGLVRLEIDGDVLELSDVDEVTYRRLVDAWLDRRSD
jgi:hypothetical protein